MAKKRRTRQMRHAFRFKIEPSGKILTFWAKVIEAKRDVFLPLRSEHIRESMKLDGVGNTQTCSMAVCAQREKECFPHSVEGFIDWYYRRAFVVSRLDKNGLPSVCYVYEHSDGIGKLNDTKGGQQKLLEQLQAAGGERVIHLMPPRNHHGSTKPRSPSRKDGSRTRVTRVAARGAKLRFAVAQAGAVPA